MNKIRVLVVDDSLFMRKVISDILRSDSAIEVVGEVSNGTDALQKIDELRPQVVTLDYEMPHMNGLETLKKIMEKENRPAVIVVSGYVGEGNDLTLQFLEEGAVDIVMKPSGSLSLDMDKVKDYLIQKVKVAAQVDVSKLQKHYRRQANKQMIFKETPGVVVIGASTGGPAALEVLLPQFPSQFPLPIVVAQHLPRQFITSFSQRLGRECQLPVIIAEDGMMLETGKIYLAPGGADTEFKKDGNTIKLSVTQNPEELESPSVDKLLQAAAEVYKESSIGIILTGMGKDGSSGAQAIKESGGKTLVQNEETSVVYGMGREVVERGLADDIVPLEGMVERISEILS